MELYAFENAVERVTGVRTARESLCGFVEVRLVIERFVEYNGAIVRFSVDIANLYNRCTRCCNFGTFRI